MSRIIISTFLSLLFSLSSFAQCKHTLTINSFDAECNGDGTSTVNINLTVLFGSGNNSATVSYNLGGGEIVAVVLEDDNDDIINQDYMFMVPTCDNYTVTLTAWTNPSGSGSSCTDPAPVTAPIILPVSFGDLELKLNGSEVEIMWSTYSEVNNEKFEIQRSVDNVDFQTIGQVDGHLNSSLKINYQFTDKLTLRGTYYYKIKQIDLDGKFTFSDLSKINYKSNSSILIFPNPARESISLSSINYDQYKIYNTVGEVVQHVYDANVNTQIDISNLDKGMYFLVSTNGEERKTFIKQ